MSFKILTSAVTVLFALVGASSGGVSFSNSYSVGNSDFGAYAKASGDVGTVPAAGQIHLGTSGEFRGTLFGMSKKAMVSVNGWNNPASTQLAMELKIDGIVLTSQSKTFGTSPSSFVLPSFSFFSAAKQFVVWGVPVVVMVDVDSVAKGGYVNYSTPVNPYSFVSPMKSVWSLYGSIGASGTLTAGPGSSLVGLGVYGTTTLGKTKLSVDRSKVLSAGTPWDFEMRADFLYGGLEIGVTAWIGDAQASATVYRVDEGMKNLKTIDF